MLADPKGFQVGDGVRLVSKYPFGKGTNLIQRTLLAARRRDARREPGRWRR